MPRDPDDPEVQQLHAAPKSPHASESATAATATRTSTSSTSTDRCRPPYQCDAVEEGPLAAQLGLGDEEAAVRTAKEERPGHDDEVNARQEDGEGLTGAESDCLTPGGGERGERGRGAEVEQCASSSGAAPAAKAAAPPSPSSPRSTSLPQLVDQSHLSSHQNDDNHHHQQQKRPPHQRAETAPLPRLSVSTYNIAPGPASGWSIEPSPLVLDDDHRTSTSSSSSLQSSSCAADESTSHFKKKRRSHSSSFAERIKDALAARPKRSSLSPPPLLGLTRSSSPISLASSAATSPSSVLRSKLFFSAQRRSTDASVSARQPSVDVLLPPSTLTASPPSMSASVTSSLDVTSFESAQAGPSKLKPPLASQPQLPSLLRDARPASRSGSHATLAGSSPSAGLAASLRASIGPLAGVGLPSAATSDDVMKGRDASPRGLRSLHQPSSPLHPPSSILLNHPKRAWTTSGVEGADDSIAGLASSAASFSSVATHHPAPVVTQIPAVPSDKDIQRQKERKERERAREREERERREREAKEAELAEELQKKEERVWGIPKKAFYLGLGSVPGSLNFNAHMAMMAGWGNGSGGLSDITAPPPQRRPSSRTSNKRRKSSESTSQSPDQKKHGSSEPHHRKETAINREDEREKEEEKLDPEELAALNAIINTRRSMAAAQALASGQVKLPAPKRRVRPPICGRQSSMESCPTCKSPADTPPAVGGGNGNGETAADAAPPSLISKDSSLSVHPSEASGASGTSAGMDCDDGPKIRFAPLPKPSPIEEDPFEATLRAEGYSDQDDDATATFSRRGSDPFGKRKSRGSMESERMAVDSEDEDGQGESDADDSDEGEGDVDDPERWKRRMRNAKGKWYLMGLPSDAFKSSTLDRAWKRWSQESMLGGGSTVKSGAISINSEDSHVGSRRPSVSRRVSAPDATVSLPGSLDSENHAAGPLAQLAASELNAEGRGRRRRRSRRNSRASRPGSARSASLSGDEEERSRRRQLIMSVRPGGTGMVTLPDGTRVKARRVGDADTDAEDLPWEDWGFAGLVARGQKAATQAADGDETKDTAAETRGEETPASEDGSPLPPPGDQQESSQQQGTGSGFSLNRAEEVRRRHEAEVAALGAEVLAAHRRKLVAANAPSPPPSVTPATAVAALNAVGSSATGASESKDPSQAAMAAAATDNLARISSRTSSNRSAVSPMTPRPPPPSQPQRSSSQVRSVSSLARASQTSLSLPTHKRSSIDARHGEHCAAFYSPDQTLPRKPDAKGYAVVPLPSELGVRPPRPREGRVWEDDDDDDDDTPISDDALSTSSEEEGDTSGSRRKDAEDEDEDDELDAAEMAEEERRHAVHSKRATTSAAGLERMHVRSRSTSMAPAEHRSRGTALRRNRTSLHEGGAGAKMTTSPSSSSVIEGEEVLMTSCDSPTSISMDASASPSLAGGRRRGASVSEIQGDLSKLVLDGTPTKRKGSKTINKAASSPMREGSEGEARQGLLRSAKSSPTIPRHRKGGSGGNARTNRRPGAAHPSNKSSQILLVDDDDLDLWPSSVTAVLGVGPSKRPSASVLTAQACTARALRERRERELREQEAARIRKLEKDDDALDYGWPPTLKGSLYDR